MRSLVPVIAFIVLSMSAGASPKPSASSAMAPVTTTLCNLNAPLGQGSSAEQKLCAQAKLRLDQQRKRMEAQAPSGECFMLKTYAPVGPVPTFSQGTIQKEYAPQVFVLRSTCSQGGQLVSKLPLSRTVPSTK